MERTLHQQLKSLYAHDGQIEVVVGSYRIDAIADGELIEIQCASLSAIKSKCQSLLKTHAVRVVKPVIHRTRIRKLDRRGKKLVSLRMSPKRGTTLDVFDELVYAAPLIRHANFKLEIPLIQVEQTRKPKPVRKRRWGRPDYSIIDVRLEQIDRTDEISGPADLWPLIGVEAPSGEFNTLDLSTQIGCDRHRAQQIAYVLRNCGAVECVGRNRQGNRFRVAG